MSKKPHLSAQQTYDSLFRQLGDNIVGPAVAKGILLGLRRNQIIPPAAGL